MPRSATRGDAGMDMRTVGEAAEQLGVTPSTVRNWIEKGYIHAVRLPSGHRRIAQTELERLLGEIFEFGSPERDEASARRVSVATVPPDEVWGP